MALLFFDGMNAPLRHNLSPEHEFIDPDPLSRRTAAIGEQRTTQSNGWNNWEETGQATANNVMGSLGNYNEQLNAAPAGATPMTLRPSTVDWGLKNTLIAGIALSTFGNQASSFINIVTEFIVLEFYDDAQGSQLSLHCLIDEDPLGLAPNGTTQPLRYRLELRRGATVLYTSPTGILPYRIGSAEAGMDDIPFPEMRTYYPRLITYGIDWLYIELKATIDPVAGSWEIRVDGNTLASDAGPTNTANQGTAGADNLRWQSLPDNVGTTRIGIDDVYLCDNVGAANNDFLGRISVVEKYMNAEGFASDWAESAGMNSHDTYVTSLNSVDDSQWLESSNPTDLELFTYVNLPRGIRDNFLCLKYTLRGALTVGGDRDVSPVYRTGGVNYVDPAFLRVTGAAFESKQFLQETNPATLAAWTRADIEGQELGFQLIA